jgi:purine nucleosidase
LDTDLGSDVDDVLALGVILGSPQLRLDAITTVYGDTRLRARLTRHALDRAGVDVPIAVGTAEPLSGKEVWWAGIEGELVEGLDAIPVDESLDAHAVLAAAATVLAIGPLTNVARALGRDHRIGHVVAMGGYFGPDPDRSEHNVGSDVVAARAVVDSGVPLTVIGLEQTTRVELGADAVAAFDHGAFGSFAAAEVRNFWRYWAATTNAPHDPLAVLMITDPELFTFAAGTVTVRDDGVTRFAPGEGPHQIVTDLDEERVVAVIVERLITTAGRG